MIVEGINVVRELLKSNYEVEKVILEKGGDKKFFLELKNLALFKNVKVEEVEKRDIQKLTKTKNPQGAIAFVKPYKYFEVEDILNSKKKENNFILILDDIQDPHNVGAIIRSAECFGVDGIIIPQNRACEINETVFKTSAGAVAHVKVAKVTNISQTIKKLQDSGVWVYALEADGENIDNANLTGNIALVVGSEGFGVSRLVRKTCDGVLSLNMLGEINSLNASNAAAIGMYIVNLKSGR